MAAGCPDKGKRRPVHNVEQAAALATSAPREDLRPRVLCVVDADGFEQVRRGVPVRKAFTLADHLAPAARAKPGNRWQPLRLEESKDEEDDEEGEEGSDEQGGNGERQQKASKSGIPQGRQGKAERNRTGAEETNITQQQSHESKRSTWEQNSINVI